MSTGKADKTPVWRDHLPTGGTTLDNRGHRVRGSQTGAETSRGSATAETAVVLPGLVLVLAAALCAVGAAGAQMACVDAARIAARAVARGESPPAARAAAERSAPTEARVLIHRGAGSVRVEVTARLRPGGHLLHALPPIVVHGDATAAVEPGGVAP